MSQLGGVSIFISAKDTQMARNEPIRDTARILSRYLDVLALRTFSQDILEEFARTADIPVINALTDLYHPCQILSDLMTVVEHKGGYDGLKIAWIGDGNNMAHSWINAASVLGLQLVLACPEGYFPDTGILDRAQAQGIGSIRVTSDPIEAATDADVLNTDVWASMGQESEEDRRKTVFKGFCVDTGCSRMQKKMLWSCTVCRLTAEKKFQKKSWKVRSPLFGIRPRINFTCIRPSWSCFLKLERIGSRFRVQRSRL
jgi:ornithine carbamoyltransferase